MVAVALLAVLAVVFGFAGMSAPVPQPAMPQQESSDSVTHFVNPPTYDSDWVNITTKAGQYATLRHDLNTTQVFVDITGKQSLDPMDGALAWNNTYGGASHDYGYSVVQTGDGGYALAGFTWSYGAGGYDFWLVKVNAEMSLEHQRNLGDSEAGLALTGLTNYAIILYRGETDPYWNYVRLRIWLIKEPTWIYGDINQDGVVDAQDLFILSQNYGKTFSLLSLSGIIAVAGIHQYKKRKQPK